MVDATEAVEDVGPNDVEATEDDGPRDGAGVTLPREPGGEARTSQRDKNFGGPSPGHLPPRTKAVSAGDPNREPR